MRTVAAEAGVSAGAVQAQFPTEDALLHVLAQQDLTARLTAAGLANPVVGATVLQAVCDGLATRLAYEPGFGTEAHRALDVALELVWTGSRAVAVT